MAEKCPGYVTGCDFASAGTLDFTEMAKLIRQPPKKTIFLSRDAEKKLKEQSPQFEQKQYLYSVCGADFRVVDFPMKKRVPRSLDRFAEYDEKDMAWAEPAGLAEWAEVDIDTMVMKNINRFGDMMFVDDSLLHSCFQPSTLLRPFTFNSGGMPCESNQKISINQP
jgi:hypothetical protein